MTQVAVALPLQGEMPGFIIAQQGEDSTAKDVVERPTLSIGSDGPLVIELQLRLQAIGVYEGEISGGFDQATQAALETFQREYGLDVTGTANPETWQALSSPATAKLEAALKTEAEAEAGSTGSDSENEEPEAAVTANNEAPGLGRSPTTLAAFAVAVAGLGLGGFGVWKAVGPKRKKPSRKSKSRKRQSQSLPVSAPPLLTAAPQTVVPQGADTTSAPEFTETSSPQSIREAADLKPDLVPPVQTLEDPLNLRSEIDEPIAAELSFGQGNSATQPENLTENQAHEQTDDLLGNKVVDRPLIPSKNLPAPPPPPSAIQHLGEPTPLTPTTRLVRQDVVETLVAQLQSTDPTQRRKAVWELGQRGDSRAIQPLVNLMSVSDSKQRSLILGALSEIGNQTLKPMKRALAMSLQDSNAEVRKNAIRDLTRIYDLVAQISNLLAIATEDEDPEVRDTARWALGQLNRIRSNAGLEQAANQQLLKNSVSAPETMSEDFQLRETELN